MNGNEDNDAMISNLTSSTFTHLDQLHSSVNDRKRSNTLSSNFTINSISSISDSLFDENSYVQSYSEEEDLGKATGIGGLQETSKQPDVGRFEDRSMTCKSNDYTPPSSYESNLDPCSSDNLASTTSEKGKGRELETKGKGKLVDSLEIEGKEHKILQLERIMSEFIFKDKEGGKLMGEVEDHDSVPSSSTIFPRSFAQAGERSSPYSANYSSLPASPACSARISSTPNLEQVSSSSSPNSPKINRIKRSFSFSRPPQLFNKDSRSFSNLSVQLERNIKSPISSVTSSPAVSRTGTPGRNTSAASLLLLGNPPDSPAESTASSRGSWKVRSKERLSKVLPSLPRIKRRNSTLPLSSNVQPLIVNSYNDLNIAGEQFLRSPPVETTGFPFPRTKPLPSRSISAPIVFTHAIFSKHNVQGEFVTAPGTPNNEETVEERSKLHFDQLPRELKVRVFGWILSGVQGDATNNVLGGVELGRRDLVRLGRVSKSWLSLSLDSQLWSNADFSLLNHVGIKSDGILRIVRSSGIYMKSLDLKGYKNLTGKELMSGLNFGMRTHDVLASSLSSLNLTGCTSLVSTAVSQIFVISPHLINVNLFALDCINSENVTILGKNAPSLLFLNVSRCRNLDPSSLIHINPDLRHLFIAGLSCLLNTTLVTLAHTFTQLITLDISFSPSITDQAFASITTPTTLNPFDSITIEFPFERKRPQRPSISKSVLPWRHLILSACKSITASTFVHLSHSLASLEILEVSRMGRRLGSGVGNVDFFLTTTPKLRKLDLENGVELTDSVLMALVPSLNVKRIRGLGVLGGCSDLETLVISTCTTFSNEGILEVVRGCSKLTTLQADGTNIEEDSVKEFINGLELKKSSGSLAILDNQTITARLFEGLNRYRTRHGRRSYWTQQFQYYDELQEYDENLVVIRSSHTNSLVDKLNLERRTVKESEVKKSGLDWQSLSKCIIS